MNYDLKMVEMMDNIEEGSRLLLHACCAPCSSACLERLADFFQISVLYYNPNITDKDEYLKRLNELKKFVSKFKTKYPVDVIDGRYDPDEFFAIAKGLEDAPERGERCYKCYNLRLLETARVADQLNIPYFTTTLSLSPYKSSRWINEIGSKLDGEFKSNFLYSDFKKREGYKRSIELSKEYDLYRQDYCGCIYSRRDK